MFDQNQFKKGIRPGVLNISNHKNVNTYESSVEEGTLIFYTDKSEEDTKVKEQFLNASSNAEAISIFMKQIEKHMALLNSKRLV